MRAEEPTKTALPQRRADNGSTSQPRGEKQKQRSRGAEQAKRSFKGEQSEALQATAHSAHTPLSSNSAPFRPSEPRVLLKQRADSHQDRVEPLTHGASRPNLITHVNI